MNYLEIREYDMINLDLVAVFCSGKNIDGDHCLTYRIPGGLFTIEFNNHTDMVNTYNGWKAIFNDRGIRTIEHKIKYVVNLELVSNICVGTNIVNAEVEYCVSYKTYGVWCNISFKTEKEALKEYERWKAAVNVQ